MRTLILAVLATTLFAFGTPVLGEELTLEQVTTNPAVGFGLDEDIKLSLGLTARTTQYDKIDGDTVGVGSGEIRLAGSYRFWTEFSGGDLFIGLEGRGFASSDTDGFNGGGHKFSNGTDSYSLLDSKELSLFAVLELRSRDDVRLFEGGPQVNWVIRAGIGGTQRDLIEEELLPSAFLELDASIRPIGSYVGGFVNARADWATEPGGHLAKQNWFIRLGMQLNTTTLLRQVRVYAMVQRENYGVLYDQGGTELDAISEARLTLKVGVSANVGPFSLFVEGGQAQSADFTMEQLSGSTLQSDSKSTELQGGVKLEF